MDHTLEDGTLPTYDDFLRALACPDSGQLPLKAFIGEDGCGYSFSPDPTQAPSSKWTRVIEIFALAKNVPLDSHPLTEQYRRQKDLPPKQIEGKARTLSELCNEAAEQLECPILRALPAEPAYAADGQLYESNDIRRWLKYNSKSPTTNCELDPSKVIESPQAKRLIHLLMKFLGVSADTDESENCIQPSLPGEHRTVMWSLKTLCACNVRDYFDRICMLNATHGSWMRFGNMDVYHHLRKQAKKLQQIPEAREAWKLMSHLYDARKACWTIDFEYQVTNGDGGSHRYEASVDESGSREEDDDMSDSTVPLSAARQREIIDAADNVAGVSAQQRGSGDEVIDLLSDSSSDSESFESRLDGSASLPDQLMPPQPQTQPRAPDPEGSDTDSTAALPYERRVQGNRPLSHGDSHGEHSEEDEASAAHEPLVLPDRQQQLAERRPVVHHAICLLDSEPDPDSDSDREFFWHLARSRDLCYSVCVMFLSLPRLWGSLRG